MPSEPFRRTMGTYDSTLCYKRLLTRCRDPGRRCTLSLDHLCRDYRNKHPGPAPCTTYSQEHMAASSFDCRGLGREDPDACYNVPPHLVRVQVLRACILTYMRKHGNIATAMLQGYGSGAIREALRCIKVCWPSRYVVLLVGFGFMMVCPILVVITLRVHGGRPSLGPL